MAPAQRLQSLQHRARRAHPLRPGITRTLARMDHADENAIRRMQDRRLRLLVAHACRRSPFYREWFRRAGIDPRSIRTTADLPQLPLLRRDDLITDAERFRTAPASFLWPARSSGTSGRVVTAYRTPGSSVYEMCALERQWSWFGLPPAPRRIILRGSDFASDPDSAPTRLVAGGRQLLVSSYRLTPDAVPHILQRMSDFAPHAVEGWPSSISLLASLLHERGERFPVRAVITSSECTTSTQRALLRSVFGGPVVDHYGQTERVAMAGTCEAGRFHVFPDYGIVELLPVDGAPDRWEIVGTPLHNWGFPLFRYRTGDHVQAASDERCRCGRAFPLLGHLHGRVEPAFTAADGHPLPLPSTAVDDIVGLREVQIAQLAPGRFEVRVVPGPGYDRTGVETAVHRNTTRLFGPGQHVTVVETGAVPRSPGGKFRSSVIEDSPIPHTGGY